jgi:hypothetical protein
VEHRYYEVFLLLVHVLSGFSCKLFLWKALHFQRILYKTFFDILSNTYALKYIIYKYSLFSAIFHVIWQHTCTDTPTVRRTTVHWSEPVGDVCSVFREEKASMPTSQFQSCPSRDKLVSLYMTVYPNIVQISCIFQQVHCTCTYKQI